MSPSKFDGHATASPTKLSVPNRKVRNQPANRVHDIEFAAEISTSLIEHVRNLQTMLAERDEEVRDLKSDKSALEIEAESLQQRVKTLDESENRYKEENWNLETRLQELATQHREAGDREKKLAQALSAANTEKSATQKELDEAKASASKLADEYAVSVKHHDIELGTAKRNISTGEGERVTLQRKIDELTTQNQELAKAFSSQRGRTLEREPGSGTSEDDFDTANDNATPDHSPPPSPIKITPRHSMLESETLKSSLHHAQRTIQSQRGLIHREKTEKLELRRIIQELRDDLERSRDNPAPVPTRKPRKPETNKDFKKPPRLLGSFRTSRQEIINEDDPEWEDKEVYYGESPHTSSANMSPVARQSVESVETLAGPAARRESTDQFDTANEASESAFETANERATETEDYRTGNEGYSDDAATETEGTRGFGKMSRPPSLPVSMAKHQSRKSFDSTASTSADEDDFSVLRTPTTTIASQRSRNRLNRGIFGRNSRHASEDPGIYSSPGSFVSSVHGTPQQSLFAELQGDFVGTDDESMGRRTPGRRSIRSVTPGSTRRALSPAPAVPALPRAIMVDSGTMTEPIELGQASAATPLPTFLSIPGSESSDKRPATMESVVGPSSADKASAQTIGTGDLSLSRPLSTLSYSDAGAQFDPDMEAELAQFPSPPTSGAVEPAPPALSLSFIQAESVEPVEDKLPLPPALSLTPLITENVEPLSEPEKPLPALSLSTISAENLSPIAEPDAPLPQLSMVAIQNEAVEPVAQPEAPAPELSISTVLGQDVEPVPEPDVPLPELRISPLMGQHIEPVSEPEALPLVLTMSTISQQEVEPVMEPQEATLPLPVPVPAPVHAVEPESPEPPKLSMSNISAQGVEPVVEPDVIVPRPALGISSIYSENHEPRAEPEIVPPSVPLSYSIIDTQHVEPIMEPEPEPETEPIVPTLTVTPIVAETIAPVVEPPTLPPALVISSIAAEGIEPISPAVKKSPGLTLPNVSLSAIKSVETEPVPPRSPWRNGFILPRDYDSPERPETPKDRVFGAVPRFGRQQDDSPVIAEDETRQSPRDTAAVETPESQRPLKEISHNTSSRPIRNAQVQFSDQGAQTSLTSEAIDNLFNIGPSSHRKTTSVGSVGTPGTTGTVRIHRPTSSSGSSSPSKRRGLDDTLYEADTLRRPASAASGRASVQEAPPLPPNHRELIEAARTNSAGGTASGSMAPPPWPASVLKNRPQTPQSHRPASAHSGAVRMTPTPRAMRSESAQGRAVDRLTARSRQSSVSSFASELDSRFNMHTGVGVDSSGFGPNTDPRMIQAITQTMIGEYLWKYTRKTGREGMSEKRHRRYFWVHPYTRTLYWGEKDPSSAGRTELKTKSVPIEAVRVVTDDNPMPPGLHRKSLVVIAPGRTLKFTCTTGQRHETWFNALSYLLMRTNADGQADAEELAGNLTQDDVDEFNPQLTARPTNGSRPNVAPSLSSYNSHATRNESPAVDVSIPTLTPQGRGLQVPRGSQGSLRKLSGYWKGGGNKISGTFSLRGRGTHSPTPGIYEASEVHDSAEDLREMIERQDREADRLENVRACCDGKINQYLPPRYEPS